MDLIITILPVVTKDLSISPRFTPYDFLSRCKLSTLTTRQPMVEFYLLTFPRFPLRKKEHKSFFGKNRTHDFRTSWCAGYLLDHSGDELILILIVILFFSFSFISLIADGPHHYHPACGHKGSSHLSPVHALQFFIAMQVQHSYISSTNG